MVLPLSRYFAILVGIAIFLFLSTQLYWTRSANVFPDGPYYGDGSTKIHLLIPATSSNAELCKCIISSYVLGYPTPTLINWEDPTALNHGNWSYGGSHIAKISGVLGYLGKGHISKKDLILLVDGYDTWFQLPPEVLISRYNRLNREADRHLEAQLGRRAVEKENIRQSIIFPAEKIGPYLGLWGSPASYAVPDPTVRADLFGNDTDEKADLGEGPQFAFRRGKLRPRWLNSGLMLGPAADIRELLYAADEYVEVVDHGGSDQILFSKIFGEQSYQREVIRLRYRSTFQRAYDWLRNLTGTYTPSVVEVDNVHTSREYMPWYEGHPYEYGVGLDYGLEISFTNTASEDDAAFLVHNTSRSLLEQQLPIEVRPDPPRVTGPVADDIRRAPPPFHLLLDSPDAGGDEEIRKQWSDVQLLTNSWTTTVAASVHINGLKILRQTFWPNMWYFPRLRELVNARAQQPEGDQPGARDDSGNFLSWENLCSGTDEEVFRETVVPEATIENAATSDDSSKDVGGPPKGPVDGPRKGKHKPKSNIKKQKPPGR